MPLGPQTWCAGQRAGLGSRSSGSPRSLSLLVPWVWEGVPPTTKWARCFLPDGCRPVGAGPLPVFSRAGAATRSSGTSDPKAPRVNLVPVLPLSSPQKQLPSAQMVLLLPQMSGLPHATVHMSPGCPPLSPSGPGCWVWPPEDAQLAGGCFRPSSRTPRGHGSASPSTMVGAFCLWTHRFGLSASVRTCQYKVTWNSSSLWSFATHKIHRFIYLFYT